MCIFIGQINNLQDEFQAMTSYWNWVDHFGIQNTLDLVAIFYMIVYLGLRILFPFGSRLVYDDYEAIE